MPGEEKNADDILKPKEWYTTLGWK
jgi:hypothetical protein